MKLSFLKLNTVISLIAIILISCSGSGESGVSLNWVAPTQREDGTSLSMAEIKGYRIYYGTISGGYEYSVDIDDRTATSVSIRTLGIPSGSYYIAMTTIDMDGRESRYSTEINVSL